MSLPVEPVFSMLKQEFVVGWRNIITEKFVGESHGYTLEQTSVGTTNGAGPRNVQLFVIAPDGTVVHVLPGFWHPEDLAVELRFAQKLLALWGDSSLSLEQKKARFSQLQLAEIANHSKQFVARSGWQGFDALNEKKRMEKGVERDTALRDAKGQLVEGKRGPKLKTINVLVHERMAKRPFLAFERFDTAVFSDYGRAYYDNNKKVDGMGSTFMTPKKVEKQQQRVKQHEARMGKVLEMILKRDAQRRTPRAQRKRKAKGTNTYE